MNNTFNNIPFAMCSLHRVVLIVLISLLITACSSTSNSTAEAPLSFTCQNTLEIQCDDAGCIENESFTPMDVRFSSTGSLSVCAYSGCWEGQAEVLAVGQLLTLAGTQIDFSTSDSEKANILINLDRSDLIATLKVGSFAQPMVCKQL